MANEQARSPEDVAKFMEEIRKKNRIMIAGMRSDIGKATLKAGWVVSNRAKEILQENNHVISGNLVRSLNAQVVEFTTDFVAVDVGSFMEYAPAIEALPDGGYLNRALEEKADTANKIMIDAGLEPSLKRWGE
jgi:hypothetical protein